MAETVTTIFKVGDKAVRNGHKLVHSITGLRLSDASVVEYNMPGTSAGKDWFTFDEIHAAPAPAAPKVSRFVVRNSGPHAGEAYVEDKQPSSTGKTFRMSIANAKKLADYANTLV